MVSHKTITWLELAKTFARENNVPQESIRVLQAFSGTNVQSTPASSFVELEAHALKQAKRLPLQIIGTLTQEVDSQQSQNFSRRFESVFALTSKLAQLSVDGRLFRCALVLRMHEILNTDGPLALRVRALNDFYFSRTALLLHRLQKPNTAQHDLQHLIQYIQWTSVTNTVSWGKLTAVFKNGPVNINILRTKHCSLKMVDCRQNNESIPFEQVVASHGATAGVSGGFFLYSEPDIQCPSRRTDPVSLLLHQGKLQNLPFFNRASLLYSKDKTLIQRIGMTSIEILCNEHAIPLEFTNTRDTELLHHKAGSFNRAYGNVSPRHPGKSIAWEANQLIAIADGRSQLKIPLAGCIITIPPHLIHVFPSHPRKLTFRLMPSSFSNGFTEGIAGGPLLIHNDKISINRHAEDFNHSAPPITFSQDETFDQNLLPRMAVGQDQNDNLFFAAIDGRNMDRALGFTLEDTAKFMQLLGCHIAMNLDGGSSKRMVVKNKIVDLSSTEVLTTNSTHRFTRPVHSAILIF